MSGTEWESLSDVKSRELLRMTGWLSEVEKDPLAGFLHLISAEKSAQGELTKLSLAVLAIYFLLASVGDVSEVSFTFQSISAELPIYLLTLVASTTLFFWCQQAQACYTLSNARGLTSAELHAYGIPADALSLMKQHSTFFASFPTPLDAGNKTVKNLIRIVCAFCIFLFTLPIPYIYFFLLKSQILHVIGSDWGFDSICAIIGATVLAASLLYLLLFNLPFPRTEPAPQR
ncbi:hypothetical protein [Pseudoroseicyclus tamaricis]|uniref:Uncharacterized protein n=1 Tax=Pseudoroseicyclus tamaricis TaxID=2705421 RepID=A0A6B2JJH9_9RHOB|nr:hypothetical protein [Pseudoroseicyclus tamaricis]NDV01593.1 hypothetical protein [Pseudoroseicyclus tamaricis]